MTILSAVEKADLTPAMAELVETSGSDSNRANALRIFAHKQEVFEPIWTAYVNMLENGKVDRDVKELVRIKIAQNNDCSAYVDKSSVQQFPHAVPSVADLNDEKIAAVGSYELSDLFSRREKLALKFAEKLNIPLELEKRSDYPLPSLDLMPYVLDNETTI